MGVATHAASNPAFELRGITKRFDDLIANEDVSFTVAANGLHGVVGENGAGKSTAMKILYGLYAPDEGEIWVRGAIAKIPDPHAAIALGIGMVHQHFMLVPSLTVWQNIVLGSEPTFRLNAPDICHSLTTLQQNFGFSLNLNALIEDLPVGLQQQVEILKLLYRKAEILILDEPTAVLTPQEVDTLFERLKHLWEAGKTIVLITHKLREILQFTRTITVMRQGKVVTSVPTAGLSEKSLAELIVGRSLAPLPTTRPASQSSVTLSVEKLTLIEHPRRILDDISFDVHQGEILGIAGVSGNGQQELIEILSNLRRPNEGTVRLAGQDLTTIPTYASRQQGLGVIAPDRYREAMIPQLSVRENAVLGHHREAMFTRGPWLSYSKIADYADGLAESFNIRPRDTRRRIGGLSGGNQQKVIVARETSHPLKLLVAAYPTRGVDIGAIEFIHSLFLQLRNAGTSIVLFSSELEEILQLSDRILVLFNGKITGDVARAKANESEIGLWMTGGKAE